MKYFKLIFLVLISFFLGGCTSTNKFTGKGDLCGFIIDENNNPISDFNIQCKGQTPYIQSTFTNESGIFVFYDLPPGSYILSGKKEGFVQLKETEYKFLQREKIFCCQVESIDTVLDSVEKMILLKDYKNGIDLLKTVYCELDSEEEKVITYYLNFINKLNEEEEINAKEKENDKN